MNMKRALAAFCVTLALGACSAQPPAGSAITPAASQSASSPTPSAAPSGWPTGDPVPAELAGRWYQGGAANSGGEVLILSGNTYSFPTAAGAGGNVVVNGNEILFFNGSACGLFLPEGIGRYSWTVSGESLNFVALARDPCGRVALTYSRTKP